MTNPFLRTIAGTFGATTDPAGKATIAERVCAALARKIASDTTKQLDPDWWSYCVNQVPRLVAGAEVSGIANLTDPAALAGVSLAPSITAMMPNAKQALTGWIGTIAQPARLNSLVVALGNDGELILSLAFIGQDQPVNAHAVPFRRSDATVNHGNSTIRTELTGVFTAAPLDAEPYYYRIERGA